jgi:hypothetical protein
LGRAKAKTAALKEKTGAFGGILFFFFGKDAPLCAKAILRKISKASFKAKLLLALAPPNKSSARRFSGKPLGALKRIKVSL